MGNTKNILFDFDGNLAVRTSTSSVIYELRDELAIDSTWTLLEPMLVHDYDEPDGLIDLYVQATQLDRHTVAAALKKVNFIERQKEEHNSYVLFSDTLESIQLAIDHGCTVNILSDMNKQWARPNENIKELFSLIPEERRFWSYKFGVTKAGPEFYQQVMNHLGVTSESCVMIGDREERDVIQAKKAGLSDAILLRHHEALAMNKSHFDHLTTDLMDSNTRVAASLKEAVKMTI